MLSKPIYEALPFCYLSLGSLSFMLLPSIYAQTLGIVIFLFGSHIYLLRSSNRRTDPKRRHKKGWLPAFIYEHIPRLFLLLSLLLLKVDSTTIPIISLLLMSSALYLALRRSLYRKHKTTDVHWLS